MRSLASEAATTEGSYDTDEENNDFDGSSENEDEQIYDGWMEGLLSEESLIECSEQRLIHRCIYKCRELVKTIRRCGVLNDLINQWKKEHDVQCTLSLDVRTRWNSTHLLIKNFMEHRLVIIKLMAEKYELDLDKKQAKKLADLEITREEWIILNNVKQLLHPFSEATRMLSAQKYPTVGLAYFTISGIREYLEEQKPGEDLLNKLKSLLLTQIDRYFDNDDDQWKQTKVSSPECRMSRQLLSADKFCSELFCQRLEEKSQK